MALACTMYTGGNDGHRDMPSDISYQEFELDEDDIALAMPPAANVPHRARLPSLPTFPHRARLLASELQEARRHQADLGQQV